MFNCGGVGECRSECRHKESSLSRRKISPPLLLGFEPFASRSRVRCSTTSTEPCPSPERSSKAGDTGRCLSHCREVTLGCWCSVECGTPSYTHTHANAHTHVAPPPPHTQTRMHTHTRARTPPHTHTHKHTRAHTLTRARTHPHTSTNTHARTHARTHTHVSRIRQHQCRQLKVWFPSRLFLL